VSKRTRIEAGRAIEGLPRTLAAALWAAALLCAGAAHAADPRFDLRVVAGINRAGLAGDALPQTTLLTNTSFLAGGAIGMQVRTNLDLSLEPSYVRRGGNAVTLVEQSGDVEQTTRIQLDYLEFPLLVRVMGSARARPYALGGIGLGFLLDATGHPPGGGSVDLSNELRSTDVYACFGGGAQASFAGHPMFVEARFTQGLTNVNRGGSAVGLPVPAYFKNTALQFAVGWRVWP
jgi:opacity protein-like surface antigen